MESFEDAPESEIDPLLGVPVDIQRIQPYQARKIYLCPGCEHEIRPGIGHIVAVPKGAPDERRHWHKSCWEKRLHRRPGR